MYIYLSSKPCAGFPENTSSDFTVQLPKTVFNVKECGVVDANLGFTPTQPVFLCSDICVESIVNECALPTLRQLTSKETSPHNIIYVPLKLSQFHTVRIFISDQTSQVPVQSGPKETVITLHLR